VRALLSLGLGLLVMAGLFMLGLLRTLHRIAAGRRPLTAVVEGEPGPLEPAIRLTPHPSVGGLVVHGISIAVAFGLSGCAAASPDVDRDEVIRRILPSTVQLRAEREGGSRRAGSGVVVASGAGRSWVVTTRHLLAPAVKQDVYVSAPGRRPRVRATLFADSADFDLALVRVDGLELQPAVLEDAVRLGQEVWIVAFPWGRRLTLVSGVVSQISSEDGEAPLEGAVRMVDASVSYGSSGGAVFDRRGALVGVVEGYRTTQITLPHAPHDVLQVPSPGETTVIPSRSIRRFLEATGLEDFAGR
jgi:S1-C subfamily serine protease